MNKLGQTARQRENPIATNRKTAHAAAAKAWLMLSYRCTRTYNSAHGCCWARNCRDDCRPDAATKEGELPPNGRDSMLNGCPATCPRSEPRSLVNKREVGFHDAVGAVQSHITHGRKIKKTAKPVSRIFQCFDPRYIKQFGASKELIRQGRFRPRCCESRPYRLPCQSLSALPILVGPIIFKS